MAAVLEYERHMSPEEFALAVRYGGYPAEGFSRRYDWRTLRNFSPNVSLTNEGIFHTLFRVPLTEIWWVDGFYMKVARSGAGTGLDKMKWLSRNKRILLTDGLPSDEVEEIELTASTSGTGTSIEKEWNREDLDVNYNRIVGGTELVATFSADGGASDISAVTLGMRYYAAQIPEEILRSLREQTIPDCEIDLLLKAAALSQWHTFANNGTY